ncbi:ribonuclease H-like domain-containing protein [Tanacetum coccineum]
MATFASAAVLDGITPFESRICLVWASILRASGQYLLRNFVLRSSQVVIELDGLFLSQRLAAPLRVFSDADWVKCPQTRKSVTGFCVFLGKSLVFWKSKKQATLSRSSTKAEYKSMSSATCETVWLQNLLQILGLFSMFPVDLHCDNSSAIQLVVNPVFHEKS